MTDPDLPRRRRVSLEVAALYAERLLEGLAPACERIEIAGSIRRQAADVGDVELVAIPRGIPCDLFGEALEEPSELDRLVDELLEAGRLQPRLTLAGSRRMGLRFKALASSGGELGVDLFIVRPPAQWGAIFAIRTGPAGYSRELVTAARRRGLRCIEGRLLDLEGNELATPEERDFFDAVGVPYAEPWNRCDS